MSLYNTIIIIIMEFYIINQYRLEIIQKNNYIDTLLFDKNIICCMVKYYIRCNIYILYKRYQMINTIVIQFITWPLYFKHNTSILMLHYNMVHLFYQKGRLYESLILKTLFQMILTNKRYTSLISEYQNVTRTSVVDTALLDSKMT